MKGCVASALVAAILIALAPNLARAESSDEAEITAMAKEHYKLGLDAYKTGKYPEAIKELKKAYLLKRLPALLLNIGATYRKMGDVDNAVYYYKKYLAEAPDARDRGEVEKTLAELDKEKPGAGANATGVAASEPSEAAGSSAAPPSGAEWKHTPVDAAPPEQPLDIRVQMPVTKGVKVYVYYRGAGQADFSQVLARRHGSEKVGRIPSDAMSGKSLQYYVEGKDDKGNVVKSFGSASDPNIVRIDQSAAPQVVASTGGDSSAKGDSAHEDLDDEAAPITGEIAEKPHKHHGSTSSGPERTARFGGVFWAGAAATVLGVASFAIGSYFLYQAKSYSDVLTADSQYRDPNTGQPYQFTDPNASPYDDKTVEARGIRDNGIGIGLAVAGGVFAVGGITMMVVDQVVLKKRGEEKPHHTAWILPTAGPNVAGVAGGITF
ncbi:MAG TPA: tetratricopeptide repeat protein [Polyangia bacterium]|nr:tetratricopeptide repeat protein [Polyangia bacterium]